MFHSNNKANPKRTPTVEELYMEDVFSEEELEMEVATDEEVTGLEHCLKLLDGMEGILNGDVDTEPVRYLQAVGSCHGITGVEGPIFDSIKNAAKTSFESMKQVVKTIADSSKEMWNDQRKKAIIEKIDSNKKELRAVKEQDAVINDSAREGLIKLAGSIDSSGEIKAMVSNLRYVRDAIPVLDKLKRKVEESFNNELNNEIKEVETTVENINKSAREATSGDEKNKDLVSLGKEKVSEATKAAKEKLTSLKKKLTERKTLTGGLSKIINGITPKIFVVNTGEEEK